MIDKSYHAFVSYGSSDRPVVERLCHDLMQAGLRPWFDKWDLVPGRPWGKGLEEGLDACPAVVVCLGEAQMGPWQAVELEAALVAAVGDPQRKVIPVWLPQASPGTNAPAFLALRHGVDLRPDWAAGVRQLVDAILGTPIAITGMPGAAVTQTIADISDITPKNDATLSRQEVDLVGTVSLKQALETDSKLFMVAVIEPHAQRGVIYKQGHQRLNFSGECEGQRRAGFKVHAWVGSRSGSEGEDFDVSFFVVSERALKQLISLQGGHGSQIPKEAFEASLVVSESIGRAKITVSRSL